jgi:hypothetical protein
MSFALRMKEITNDVPIIDTTTKEKDVIEMETKDGIQDQNHENVNFQSKIDNDEETSSHVKWHSKQYDLAGEKENQNPDHVLIKNMFARLSPLSCPLGRLPPNASPPQGVRTRRSKLIDVDCTIKKIKGKRLHKTPSRPLDVVSKCQTRACGSLELNRPKKCNKFMKVFQICQMTLFLYKLCLSIFWTFL